MNQKVHLSPILPRLSSKNKIISDQFLNKEAQDKYDINVQDSNKVESIPLKNEDIENKLNAIKHDTCFHKNDICSQMNHPHRCMSDGSARIYDGISGTSFNIYNCKKNEVVKKETTNVEIEVEEKKPITYKGSVSVHSLHFPNLKYSQNKNESNVNINDRIAKDLANIHSLINSSIENNNIILKHMKENSLKIKRIMFIIKRKELGYDKNLFFKHKSDINNESHLSSKLKDIKMEFFKMQNDIDELKAGTKKIKKDRSCTCYDVLTAAFMIFNIIQITVVFAYSLSLM